MAKIVHPIAKRLSKNISKSIADWGLIEEAIRTELHGARCVLAFEGNIYGSSEPVICLVLKGQPEPECTFKIKNKTAFRLSAPRTDDERVIMVKGIKKLISSMQTKLAK